ncbi:MULTISPECIES: PP2C family protein-serine/threonine phosphatase [unclassified Rhodococcus (in: high G+C Gram-positive bacteria)]|uniref:PP2C family protein-serine/threonine phosphatase n=1 Tax=unclassified Rhodococcus (in: high G+C Gram-positive bacteria) TaxID=192944 RepID=UPI000304F03A|nr:SpoIIE family protein phosphatase [Rhodococcus sp. DK17]
MDIPIIAADTEIARLRSLEQLAILDTAPEARFDQITRMARHLFGVPMSAVSLLDRDRQWIKSTQGLDMQNIPRSQTVCETTIARAYHHPEDPMVILEDARRDTVFADLPGVAADGGVRFYAGYPLYGPGGHPVGTFCIYDTEPRRLDSAQLAAFVELAEWAQRELEHSDELERAARIQRELLPRQEIDLPGYDLESSCVQAFAVGGDFYDYYRIGPYSMFSLADVMGKGLGAAILTASVRSALRGVTHALAGYGDDRPDLGRTLAAVAAQLADDFDRTGTFVTLFHAALDVESGALDYVDGGHGLAMIVRRDGTVEPLRSSGLPLGVIENHSWTAQHTTLHPGDMLMICSDGLLDHLDDADCEWKSVPAFAAAHPSPKQLLAAVHTLAAATAPLDDITVVALRRRDC